MRITVMSNVNLLENIHTRNGRMPLFRTLSARDMFPILNQMRLDARPVVGQDRGPYKLDKTGRKRYFGKPTPIYGTSTFRNAIEKGRHV